jgi:hypothetical protein
MIGRERGSLGRLGTCDDESMILIRLFEYHSLYQVHHERHSYCMMTRCYIRSTDLVHRSPAHALLRSVCKLHSFTHAQNPIQRGWGAHN